MHSGWILLLLTFAAELSAVDCFRMDMIGRGCKHSQECGLYLVCLKDATNSSKCLPCTSDDQCSYPYKCKYSSSDGAQLCLLKGLFPLNFREFLCYVVVFVGGAFASAGGIGGGGLFVPAYMLVGGLPAQTAIPLSKATIFGGVLSAVLRNLRKHHPTLPDEPLVNYPVALALEPVTLAGTVVGVLLNVIFPAWLIVVCLAIILTLTAVRTFRTGVRRWRKETVERRALRQASAGSSHVEESPRGDFCASEHASLDTDDSGPPSFEDDPVVGGARPPQYEECEVGEPEGSASGTRPPLFARSEVGEPEGSASSTRPPLFARFEVGDVEMHELGSQLGVVASDVSEAGAAGVQAPDEVESSVEGLVSGSSEGARKRLHRSWRSYFAEKWLFDMPGSLQVARQRIRRPRRPESRPVAPSVLCDADVDFGNSGRSDSRSVEFETVSTRVRRRLRVLRSRSLVVFLVLVALWVVVFVLSLLRGGHGAPSVVGIRTCSALYWALMGMVFPVMAFSSGGATVWLRKVYRRKMRLGLAAGEVKWRLRNCLLYPSIALFAGVAAGFLGIGGGMIKSPLMLEMGIHSQSVSGTSTFMILFTSSATTMQFTILGMLPWDYGLFGFAVGLTAFAIGQAVIGRIIARLQRPSMIVFILGLVIACSALLLTVSGSIVVARQIREHAYMGFSSACK